MRFLAVLVNYLVWHYTRAVADFSLIYKNIIVFVFNFFSVPILVKSYLAPWRRMGEAYPKDVLAFGDMISTFIVNIIVRLVGIFMRTIMIVIGLLATFLTILFYPVLILIWLFLPLAIVILFLLGLGLLFK